MQDYQGRFDYAGGHPDAPTAAGLLSRNRVRVGIDGLVYETQRRGAWQTEFTIAPHEIAAVAHEQSGGRFLGAPDQFVVVTLRRTSADFAVKLKATGMTKQRDAFALVAALSALIGQRT